MCVPITSLTAMPMDGTTELKGKIPSLLPLLMVILGLLRDVANSKCSPFFGVAQLIITTADSRKKRIEKPLGFMARPPIEMPKRVLNTHLNPGTDCV